MTLKCTSKGFQLHKVGTKSTVQVRKKKEAGAYECVAENGNGDPVSATAELTVFEGDFSREEENCEHDQHNMRL